MGGSHSFYCWKTGFRRQPSLYKVAEGSYLFCVFQSGECGGGQGLGVVRNTLLVVCLGSVHQCAHFAVGTLILHNS